MIDTAVKAVLAADGQLTSILGNYQGGPAIFVQNDVPAQFDRGARPYIALRDGQASDYLDGDRDFFTAPCEILVLQADQGDAAQCEAAAWRVRAILDGAAVAPVGYANAGTVVEVGPEPQDQDDLTFGRRLRIIVGLIEQP